MQTFHPGEGEENAGEGKCLFLFVIMKREVFLLSSSYVDMGNIIKAFLAVLFPAVYRMRRKSIKIWNSALEAFRVISRCTK